MDNTLANGDTKSSLLWSYYLSPALPAQQINIEDIKSAHENGGYTWIHLQADIIGVEQQLVSLGLNEMVIEGLCTHETRPRAVQIGDGILIYLRGINLNPQADPEDMVSLRVWLTEKAIITARRKGRRLLSVQDVKDDIDVGKIPDSPGELMLNLISKIAERINESVDALDEELTDFEALEKAENNDRVKLSSIRRQAASIRRYLAPQRDALDAIYRIKTSLTQEQLFELRELSDRMTRYVEDLDLTKERAMVQQDELRNRIAEQQGMRMYVLSLVTAIFLPLSFLTGVFGMNVAGLPGLENPSAFGILASCMGVLALLLLAVMAWKKWF